LWQEGKTTSIQRGFEVSVSLEETMGVQVGRKVVQVANQVLLMVTQVLLMVMQAYQTAKENESAAEKSHELKETAPSEPGTATETISQGWVSHSVQQLPL